jgi:hypothetical protein
MESQLQNIFDEEMQRKRISKCSFAIMWEITTFVNNDELKVLFDHRITYIRKE